MATVSPGATLLASVGIFLALVAGGELGPDAGACDGAETCSQLAARSEQEVEMEEAAEIGAMEVRLIQSRLDQVSLARVGPGKKADSTVNAAPSASTHASASLDHNGNLCLLCSKPKAERVGSKVYQEFRDDCGGKSGPEGPTKESLLAPVVSLGERGLDGKRSTNAFCELNFAKSCVDAVANKDYLYWAKSLDFSAPNMRRDAMFDARYCHLNGFLEKDIVALQHNFTGMQEKARELCETKYAKYDVEKLSFVDMMRQARYNDASAPSLDEAELLAAWNCGMGDLGCDMAGCAYSFCRKSENSYGIYDECQGWDPVHGMGTESKQPDQVAGQSPGD